MSNSLKYNANILCDRCGNYGAFEFKDENMCSDCYCEQGSCCMEFGGDDLWEKEETQSKLKQKHEEQ